MECTCPHSTGSQVYCRAESHYNTPRSSKKKEKKKEKISEAISVKQNIIVVWQNNVYENMYPSADTNMTAAK